MSELQTIIADPQPEKLVTEQAYERVLAEILAVPENELLPITVDIVSSTTTVLGTLPEIKAMRPQIAEAWRNFDFTRFDKLEDYALALTHANYIYLGSAKPKRPLTELGSELSALRDRLLADAWCLANHGLINPERLKGCKASKSYRAIATDVLTIGGVFRDRWRDLAGKTPVTPEFLESAGKKALALMAAIGEKKQAPAMMVEAAQVRKRAYTLFMSAYEEVRRAIVYLRGKFGDADQIAPSLYRGRGGRRRLDDEATELSPVNPEATEIAATDGAEAVAVPSIPIDNQAGLPMTAPFGA